MINTKFKILALSVFTASALSGCAMVEGAGQDFKNWGNYLDRQFSKDSEEVAQTSSLQQSVLASNCPPVEQPPQLSSLHEFIDPANPSMDSKLASADIMSVRNQCEKEGSFLSVTMDITFNSMLGPRGRTNASDRPFFSFPYYIAVKDADNTVLAKEVFAVSVSYEPGEQAISTVETIKQNLPLNDDGSLPNYKMQVGFELTEEQISFNAGH